MPGIDDIGSWIRANEALLSGLSGLAAMIALAAVILSALGSGMRRLFARNGRAQPSTAQPEPVPATSRLALQDPIAPAPHPAQPAVADFKVERAGAQAVPKEAFLPPTLVSCTEPQIT